MVLDGGEFQRPGLDYLQRQGITGDVQIAGVVHMAVQVAQGVAGCPAARAGQFLCFVHQLGQLPFQILVPVTGRMPGGLAQDALAIGIHHDPPAVDQSTLLPCFVQNAGQPLHRTLLARLTGGKKRQLFGAQGHPGDLRRLLAHQKRRVVRFEKSIIHAVGAGVICRRLLHIAEQGAGLDHPAKIAVCVQDSCMIGILIHTFPFQKRTLSVIASHCQRL